MAENTLLIMQPAVHKQNTSKANPKDIVAAVSRLEKLKRRIDNVVWKRHYGLFKTSIRLANWEPKFAWQQRYLDWRLKSVDYRLAKTELLTQQLDKERLELAEKIVADTQACGKDLADYCKRKELFYQRMEKYTLPAFVYPGVLLGINTIIGNPPSQLQIDLSWIGVGMILAFPIYVPLEHKFCKMSVKYGTIEQKIEEERLHAKMEREHPGAENVSRKAAYNICMAFLYG